MTQETTPSDMGQKYEVVEAAAATSSPSSDDEEGWSAPDLHDPGESSIDDGGMPSFVSVPPSRRRVLLLVGVAFASGAVVGGCAVGAALASPASRGAGADLGVLGADGWADGGADGGFDDGGAVSYGFLETDKGSRTLRLLLEDLLLPPDDLGGAPSSLAGLTGPRRALTRLSALMESDPQVESSCHPLAHNLGRAAYEAFGGHEGAFDGMVGTDDAKFVRLCNAAYLHGVIGESSQLILQRVWMPNLESSRLLDQMEWHFLVKRVPPQGNAARPRRRRGELPADQPLLPPDERRHGRVGVRTRHRTRDRPEPPGGALGDRRPPRGA